MIEVQGITKYYGEFKALSDVSFHVDKGEVLGFLGPNGAGKSTTMKVLTTFISASEGTASVGGYDVHVFPHEVQKRIGYLPETPPLYADMTVEEYLKFVGHARGLRGRNLKGRLEDVVADCGLRTKLKSRVAELSKGFRQRTGLAQALIHDPDVLILDEPTSGLDPVQILEIRKLIEKLREDKCIIFSTHILQEATAVANRLVIINQGRVVADGTVDELAAKSASTQSVRLLVKGADETLAEPLRNVENVNLVRQVQGPTGYARFELQIGGGITAIREACENIDTLAQGKGLKVAELAPERLTLEQIFVNLLTRETSPADGEKSEPAEPEKKPAEKPEAKTEEKAGDADKEEEPLPGSATERPGQPPEPKEPVAPNLPDDPDATAAATRITGKPTTSEQYNVDPASETAYDAPDENNKDDEDDDDDAEEGDPFETLKAKDPTRVFDTIQPGEPERTSDTEAATDTEYSPRPDDVPESKEGA